eukprot:2070241-Prymnesium_polylepis.2
MIEVGQRGSRAGRGARSVAHSLAARREGRRAHRPPLLTPVTPLPDAVQRLALRRKAARKGRRRVACRGARPARPLCIRQNCRRRRRCYRRRRRCRRCRRRIRAGWRLGFRALERRAE